MKKIGFILLILLTFSLFSCGGKTKESKAKDEFVNQVMKSSSYELAGEMEVKKESSTVSFTMDIKYAAPAYYKVIYVNKTSNTRQVLLKNTDGVYVLSPELNKEFKFESTWPMNSSHIYILNKVAQDIKDDSNSQTKTEDDYYVITSKISHKIRTDLVSQSVYLNKDDYSINYITYNTENDSPLKFKVSSIKYDVTFPSKTFNVEAIMESETALLGEGTLEKASSIVFGDVIEGVTLTSSNVSDEYTMLSYGGSKSYKVIYQNTITATASTIERIFDDFVLLDSTVGFFSPNALTFYMKDKEFKIISDNLTQAEMVTVANSLVIN